MNWFRRLINFLFGNNTEKNDNQEDIPTTNKRGVCLGINDYPGTGNDLSGCLNDCDTWANILSSLNFSVTKLKNAEVTRQAFKDALTSLVKNAVAGDILVFTYSGHGSFVVNMNNPEPDKKDETIYTYDGNVFDYEIRNILDNLKDGVSLTVILDSCHSGTGTRIAYFGTAKPRFMPPRDPAMAALGYLPTAKRVFVPESQMKEILFSGCLSSEYSYDAHIGGIAMGAFSYYATQALKKNPNMTCLQLYNEIRKSLPSNDYPQTPQLEGQDDNKMRKVFT